MSRKLSKFFIAAIACLLPIIVQAQVIANFSANVISGCSPIVVQFTDLSTGNPTSWQWDLGNSATSTLQNPSTTYVNPGTYTVTLTATNATGSNTKTVVGYINVIPSPIIDFVGDTTSTCVPKTVQFTSSVIAGMPGAVTYAWDFGDGFTGNTPNPLHVYNVAGNYSVTFIVTNSQGCNKAIVKNAYIHAIAKPNASFTMTNNASCTAPLTVSFTNTSLNASSYSWDFGDGGTSTSASPTHPYTTAGFYNVRLIATSIGGCSDTVTINNGVVISNPVAAFTPSTLNTCLGNTINFTNNTLPTVAGMVWSFGDGDTSTAFSPAHSYTALGTYPVKLVATVGACKDSVTINVNVTPKPVPHISATSYASCNLPFTPTFSNTTTGASSYIWYFGDGGTSTATNPSHTYNSLGVFNVTLISTSPYGCSDTTVYSNYMYTYQPLAAITATPLAGCVPLNTTFQPNVQTVSPVVSYNWDYGDGFSGTGTSPSHTYTAQGIYTVTLTGTTQDGCNFSATTTVDARDRPTTAFYATPTTTCVNTSIAFYTIGTGATSYNWFYGNGTSSGPTTATSIVTSYGAPGGYSPFLVTSNGACKDTLLINNYISITGPSAFFTPVFFCANRLMITFSNQSTGATTYHWDFGDGGTSTAFSPTHTFPAYGTYTVVLTDSAGNCQNVATKIIDLFPIPTGFTTADTNICKGGAALFTPAFDSHQLNYQWSFGNGNTQTAIGSQVVANGYLLGGQYTVKLVVSDSNGCKDSLVRTNYVKVSEMTPALTGAPTSGCSPLNVQFTDGSTSTQGAITNSRKWYFGDGFTFTNGNVSPINHTYISSVPVTYNVKMVVTNNFGCKDSVTLPLVTITRPVASFTADSTACKGQTISFINNTVGNNPTYEWTFGDGGTSSLTNPTHIYNTAGSYSVRLIAIDAGGCRDTLLKPNFMQVHTVVPSFTMSDTAADCPPLLILFNSTTPGINTYLWTFGNNNTSTLSNPSTVYTVSGIYHPKLIITDDFGCQDSLTKTVTLTGPNGTLAYSPLSGCMPLTVNFSSVATFTQTYYWDMNNGTTITSSVGNASYTYTQPGNYVPVLILTSGANCTKVVQGVDTIKIEELSGNFTFPSPICQNTTIQFTDSAHDSQPAIITRAWAFGDGGTSALHNPSHTYVTPGTYTVRLILTNNHGCIDTILHTIVVHALPNVTAASNQSICAGTSASLLASGANTYTWSPSTGLSCTACANPTATPGATTTYVVFGVDTAGCSDTGMVSIIVNPIPAVTATGTATICAFSSTILHAFGATSYSWAPATGLSCTNCANPTASPTTTTTYTVTGTSLGCSSTAQVTVTVNNTPTLTITPNTSICAGGSVPLSVSGAANVTWSPATGLSCTTCLNPTATPAATTTYTVTATNSFGCVSTGTVTVSVVTLPAVNAGPAQTLCTGGSVTLNATGASTYSWSPSTGLSCTNCASPVATPTATTTYTVTGSISGGCSNTSTVTVTVSPTPPVSAGPDLNVCFGLSTTLSATGANTYVWSPSTGLSCTNCASPTASPTVTTTYVVTGTVTATGCTKTDTVVVTVLPKPTISAGNPQTICLTTSAQLQATGGVSYTWAPGATLSCTNCANPLATPTFNTTYTVTGTGANGCTNTSTVTVTLYAQPVINAGTNQNICSGNSVQLQASGASSYVWSPATGLSCTLCANPTASPTVTTIYKAVGTSINGCKDSNTVTVTVAPLPPVSAGPDLSICSGLSTTLSATGGNTYVWSPATGLSCTNCASPTASPTVTTTYVVTGTATATGCIKTDTVVVTVLPLPAISAGASVSICLGGSAPLQATGGASYSWTPATGLSCTNCANPTATPATTTTYTVTGTGANGCINTSTVTVSVVTLPPVSAGPAQTLCPGSTVTLNATGATTFSWSPSTGLSCTNCASPIASPATTTTYTVTGSVSGGCSNTSTVTITVAPLPLVSAGPDLSMCSGLSTTLSATGASTYVWSPATGLSCTNCASPTASPTVTTTYVVTGTAAVTGCTKTDTVVVTVLPLPTISAGAPVSICLGGSAPLQATGGVSYNWTPGATLSCTNCANPTATPTTTTTYTVTGTGANGCINTSTVTVSVVTLPPVSAGPAQTLCPGSTVTLNATGATTFSWSPSTGLSCTNCASPIASPATTTTYTVTGSVSGGCSNTSTVTVTVAPLPPVSAGPDLSMCSGLSTTLSATGASTYVWSPATGLSCTNCASPTASPTVTTTYVVTGTAAVTGCTKTDTVVVTVLPLPTISAGAPVSICLGGSTPLQATGGVSYNWTPGATLSCTNCANPTATPTSNTTYTVTGTGANGCVSTSTVTVSVVTLPPVSAGPAQTLCVGNTVTLNATGATTYSWSPSTGLSCTNCASPVANPTVTTTYTVTGSISGGCSNTSNVTVTVAPLPPVSAGADASICSGGSTGLTATGASTYVWSPSTGLSCTNCANPTASPTTTTTYIVTGTAAITGCVKTDTVIVTVLPLPAISAGSPVSICFGGSTTLQATGGVSYTWTPGATLSCTSCASPTATPTTNTTYTVTGTGANGCTNTGTVTVSVVTLPPVSAGPAQTLCPGNSVTLNATGATTYSWSPSTGLSCTNCASPVASPIVTTTYTVTGSISGGCSNTSTVTITVSPLPPVNAGADVNICSGGSTGLTATGASTYVWSPSTGLSCTNCASPTASPAATTSYVVTGTAATGCVKKDTVVVTVLPLPTISAGSPQTICRTTSAQLQATGGVSYTWTPGATLSCTNCANPLATPLANTTYTVTGTGANGCTNTSTVTVSLYAQPVINAGSNQNICLGGSAQLQASGAVSYVWSPATTLSCTACSNPVATPTVTTIYKVVGTSVNGCKDSSTVTVTVSQLPAVSAGTNPTICLGASTNLQATGAATYLWSPATGLSCTACANPVASPATTTTYTVTGTSGSLCSSTAQVTVTVLPVPSIDAGPNATICKTASTQLQANGGVTYTWSPATGLSCTSCANPIASPTSTTTYTVTGTGTNGCTNTSTVQVGLFPQPVIDAGVDKTICAGQFTNLLASGGATYLWTPATALSCVNCPDPVASPLTDITYTVVGTDGNGCHDSDKVKITVIQKTPTSVGPELDICKGDKVQLHASGGQSYSWSPSSSLSNSQLADPTASPDVTTQYSVIIKQNACFDDTLSQTVVVHPVPTVNLGPDKVIFAGESIQLNAVTTNATIYAWEPGEGLSCVDCTNPTVTPTHSTTYIITVYNEFGCHATDDIRITLKCDGSMIFVPNMFTPNGDQQNDRFYPMGRGMTTVDRFRVYDRWGELLFDMVNMPVNDAAAGWDGTYKNQVLKPDVYVYILDATCVNGDHIQTKGDVSLVR
jgi:gliding motility-associated-like protein